MVAEQSAESIKYSLKADKAHLGRYLYHLLEFKGITEKLTVVCREHGPFEISAQHHLYRKQGCRKCWLERVKKAEKPPKKPRKPKPPARPRGDNGRGKLWNDEHTVRFVRKATLMWGELYDYSDSHYCQENGKISIVCHEHGVFYKQPGNHLRGQGCPMCPRTHGYQENKPGNFYVLSSEGITKVGITNRDVVVRAKKISSSKGTPFDVTLILSFENGAHAKSLESLTLEWLELRYKRVSEKFDGYTECFETVEKTRLIDFVLQTAATLK